MARILVIDDDRNLLQMVKLMIERAGHEALLAHSGEEGIEMALARRPDLAIIDVMMPGLSGYEVTRRLRKDSRTAKMRIMILTARSQPMDEQMGRDAGAERFIAKPVTANELVAEINALLEHAPQPVESAPLVVTVLGLRGGAGATTIAVNLALALTARGGRVCLVDLSPCAGHAALQLRLVGAHSWGDLLERGNTLPAEMVKGLLMTHEASKLAVLSAPAKPTLQSLSEEAARALLEALRESFHVVVLDARSLAAATTVALRASGAVVVPMGDDVLSIQTTTGVLRLLKEMELDMEHVHVVLNHVRPDAALPLAAVQKAIRHPLNVELPYEAAQAAALGRGTPLIMAQPKSAFAQGILRLSRAV